uniref:Uncharacterized protein n=1 Tax=Knipowitschia caucasica TaxID=637954 RepID=A0AAV2JDD2_KNICA
MTPHASSPAAHGNCSFPSGFGAGSGCGVICVSGLMLFPSSSPSFFKTQRISHTSSECDGCFDPGPDLISMRDETQGVPHS